MGWLADAIDRLFNLRDLWLALTPPVVAAVFVSVWAWGFGVVDIVRTPAARWEAAGRAKWLWTLFMALALAVAVLMVVLDLGSLVVLVVVGAALAVPTIAYMSKVRPRLDATRTTAVSTRPRAGDDAAPGSSSSLTFDGIGMTFRDGTEALRDVSFAVDRGEFVTVVGPSGCGKSTLLRIASGLLAQTAGTVTVDRQRLGYVFQDATLLPWRTVRQNVELLAELHQIDPTERAKLATEAIDLVGLTGFENHYPKALSGGMRMRCSLARTLTLKPPVFLFDEPFGAVDEITREHLNEETQQLFQLEGFAGLFITHSISEAVFMSTKVYVMSARPGRIVAEYDVPFPYPRQPDLRFEPEFAELSGNVSHALRGSHV